MAKWKVTPGTVGNTLTGGIDYDDQGSSWKIAQDINPILESTKQDREKENKKSHYRKAFSIPHIVAIEIKEKFNLDIWAPDFWHDENRKAKLFNIIEMHYPLLKSTNDSIMR